MDALENKNKMEEQQEKTNVTINENLTNEEQHTQEENDPVTETTAQLDQLTQEQLCKHLQQLLEQDVTTVKEEVEKTKQNFYKKNQEAIDQQRLAYQENGGEEKDFIPTVTPIEEEFKKLLGQYKDKKNKYLEELSRQKEQNLLKKRHIVEQIKKLTETHEDVTANITQFRNLQQEWKETGAVPVADANDLWRDYNKYQEDFWDLIKINNELREYDFKKNKELKTQLIEQAIKLHEEEDVVKAFRALQKLHDEWREIGPVSREEREDIWTKFKEASTVINKKHQTYFEELHANEIENLQKKTELCEKLEAVTTENLKTFKDWEKTTQYIISLQEEWRKIGFAPRKDNKKIYERYRTACDLFFEKKSNYYKEVKNELAENLEKKKALCEKAEALKDSDDWKETTEKLIQIQKDWKKIGAVQRKQSDVVWKRFIAACDYFFERKNENMSGQRKDEIENLKKKQDIIARIKDFEKLSTDKESVDALRTISAEWNEIGYVPFKEKDKIYKAYHEALDEQFEALNVDATQRKLEAFQSNLEGIGEQGEKQIQRERQRLVRSYEYLKSEIKTYENNIGFFSVSSKKGNGMLADMQRKIDKLREEMELLEEKIKMIDQKL